MYNNKIRIPLLIGIVIMMILDLTDVIHVPGIVIILIIIVLLWYNMSIRRNRRPHSDRTNKK